MARPDLSAHVSVCRSSARRSFRDCLRLCLPVLFLFTFLVFATPSGKAQEQQTEDQDVAKAARQERARQQASKKSKHVYTSEDLKRDRILTPEDRAEAEARKHQPAPAPQQDAFDAQTLAPNAPLGDIARSLQRQKESLKLRRSTEFHLGLPDAPALARPKPPLEPLRPPIIVIPPARPSVVGPFHPPVKRSPFERPHFLSPAISTPQASPALPTPRAPHPALEAPQAVPTTRSAARVSPIAPETPRARVTAPPLHGAFRAPPVIGVAPPSAPVVIESVTKTASVVMVHTGDSLWKLAAQHLGSGLRWQELLVVNPEIRNPNHIVAGSTIVLPAAIPAQRTTKYTVQKGDTLWTIAQSYLGQATSWFCIAQANPDLRDANFIREGQRLTLPASCPR